MKDSEVLYWHLKKHIVSLVYVQLIFGQTRNVGLRLQRMKTEQEDRQENPFSIDEFKTKVSTLGFKSILLIKFNLPNMLLSSIL